MPLPPNIDNLTLVTLDKITRIKDRWIVKDPIVIARLNSIGSTHTFQNFSDTFGSYRDTATQISQQACIHVVTETVFDYPTVFVSEKTYKPILNKRPFILVASVGCLQNLKDAGFKTFNNFWDESYDSILDPTQRMLALTELIKSLCTKSISELQDMCRAMESIIDYNFDYYHNHFLLDQLEKFDLACQKLQGIR
jgi:hypothetical protein